MSKKEITGGIIIIAILITGVVIKNYLFTGKKITQDTSKARHVSEDDIKRVEQNIPKFSLIELWASYHSPESVVYGAELARALKYDGYPLKGRLVGNLVRTLDQNQKRFEIENKNNVFSIYIYPQ